MKKQKEDAVQSKELSVDEKKAMQLKEMHDSQDWAAPALTQRDIVIPRLLLMQPMSELVTAGKAAFGDIIDSLNRTKFGGFEKAPVEFVPFLMEKSFVVFNNNDPEEKEFMRIDPITPQNEDAKYEDEEKDPESGDIIKISRIRTQTFYVLLKSELDQGTAIPYIIAFSKTSLQAGKKIAAQMYVKNVNSGKIPAAMMMGLSVEKQSQDKKTWAVFNVEATSETSQEHQLEAFKWLKLIKAGKAKVHADAFVEETAEKVVSKEKVDLNEPSDF